MRLNGALKPHGAPDGCSIGAKKYRDKRSQRVNGGFNLTNTKSNCKYSKYFDSPDCNSNSSRSSLSSIEEITSISSSRESINIGNTNNNNSLNMKKQKIHTFFQNQLNNECSEQSQLKINKKLTNNQLQGTDNIQHSPSVISTNPTMEQELNSVRCSNSGGRKKSKRFSIKNHGGGGGDDCGDRDDNDNDMDNGKANGNGKGLRKLFNKMKRVQQSLYAGFGFSYSTLILCLFYVILLQPNNILCDEENNFFIKSFSLGQETTVPEFDYASRGKKKFGDKCDNTLECGFPGSICDPKKKSCQCTEDLPITNHFDKCGKEAAVNESCFFNEQCESFYFQTECRDNRCICRFELSPIYNKDGTFECQGRQEKRGPETYVDPAMIGVLVGMALMFVIICVVLRLFSQARWRENRTIFNTPNPRLMNVSLLRDSKLLHGQERRGSRMSVRAPSRQPSMASLRPHSPNPSLGKTGSRGSSNGSATSVRSGRSNSALPGTIINPNTTSHERKHSAPHSHPHLPPHQHQHQHQHQHSAAHSAPHSHPHHQHNQHQQQQQPLITNITPNPVAESITVEIIEPDNK